MMPRPNDLSREVAYPLVWSGQLSVKGADQHGGAEKNKNFFAYLEVEYQAKHDKSLAGYCRRNNLEPRNTADTQVSPPNNGDPNYYASRGQVACKRVAAYMHDRWTKNTTNDSVFDPAGKQPLGVQKEVQEDDWKYDITMYYRVGEVHVAFHCYPSK